LLRQLMLRSTLITTNRPTQDWGVLPRRCTGGDREPRSVPGPRHDRADDGEIGFASARARPATQAVDGAAAVDAQSAPTAAGKTHRTRFPHRPPLSPDLKQNNDEERPAACAPLRTQTILTPPTAWPVFKRSSPAAFERSVTHSARAVEMSRRPSNRDRMSPCAWRPTND
jgi:hypothetical protein